MLTKGFSVSKQLWLKLRIGGILLLKQRWEFSHALRRLLPKVYCLICKKRKREDIYHFLFECDNDELNMLTKCCLRLEFESLSAEERLVFLISGKVLSLGWDLSEGCSDSGGGSRVENIGIKYLSLLFKE